MSRQLLARLVLLASLCGLVACRSTPVGTERFSCETEEDCIAGRKCRHGFCLGPADDGTCVKTTCALEDRACGSIDDGCGGQVDCGDCDGTGVCGAVRAGECCQPTTCAAAGRSCGSLDDGCGRTVSCGACDFPDTCGGGGTPGVCGCRPRTCQALEKNCGPVSDGCGHLLDCGTCSAPETCGGSGTANVCGCRPATCETLGASCGSVPDGCGHMLACGTCTAPESCGGGGTANTCGCRPTTCAAAGASCGSIPDGCGNLLDCGGCTAPETCGGGGVAHACGKTWPWGADGALRVRSGETSTIANGSLKDFSSIRVDAGGVLEISGGGAWTIIGIAGDLVLDGTIRATGNGEYVSTPGGRVIGATAPDDEGQPNGEGLSFTLLQKQGGGGGLAGGDNIDRRPGAAAGGNGGGGVGFAYLNNNSPCFWVFDQTGGASFGKDATVTKAGDGGASSCGNLGSGAALYGQPGTAAPFALCGPSDWASGGGGGGGGSRGAHGQALYLKVKGAITGQGTIEAGGQAGGDGASGTTGICGFHQTACYCITSGGGGGGGAGGSGGKVVIRHGGPIPADFASQVHVTGGRGGAGGSGGSGTYPGKPGTPGGDGAPGTIDVGPVP